MAESSTYQAMMTAMPEMRSRARRGMQERTKILHLVALPAPLLEFEGKHRYLAHEQVAAHQHAHDHGHGPKGRGLEMGSHTHHQRAPEERVSRGGQSDEAQGLALVEIELGQAKGREGRHDEGHEGQHLAQGLQGRGIGHHAQFGKEHGRGSQSEGDVVRQRVELLADRRTDMEQAGRHAVEEIEDGSYDHPRQGPFEVVAEGKIGSDATRDEVAAGDAVGDMFLDHKQ